MTPQWLLTAMNQRCQIYRRKETEPDEYGNPAYSSVLVGESRCLLQPATQSDLQQGRAAVGSFNMYLPATVAELVDAFSSYVVDGDEYEADGPPAMYIQLFQTSIHHIEASVSRSTA
jgi:hypothetical protein